MGFFKSIVGKIKAGLGKTREVFVAGLKSILLGKRLDEKLIDEIEQRLLLADVGTATTAKLIDRIRADFRAGKMDQGDQALDYMKAELKAMWPEQDRELHFAMAGPTVILVTGVNGVGKTTSIAKLCATFRASGKSVMLAACDTFRAGAVRQLEIWGERLGVTVIKGQQGGDPAAVAFDACAAAKARGVDILIIDTAGRLQTQDPLMRQLAKIRSVITKQIAGAPHETLLVLDATQGQNALRQAVEFSKTLGGDQGASGLTGIFLSKLDGTAKGGIVIAIKDTTKIPVKFIGVGETPEDVQPFDPVAFVDAMFEE
ncbi:MAG: signal recognition particle-docking protein FtsY [Planctomycetota bacterium]